MSTTNKSHKPRVADEIMAGMRELQRMMDEGKTPLRDKLSVSQAVFAHLLGVSVVLVKSWERGVREPSPLARRLLDTIEANPSQWLTMVTQSAA